MRRTIAITTAILVPVLALAACDKAPKQQATLQNAKIAQESAALNQGGAATQDAEPGAPGGAAKPPSPADHNIPVALQGRWAMVPKDCGPDASIAKGLMTIDGKQLRFYESVAKPAVVNYPTPMRMEGRFSFTGEGMEWSKDMALSVEGDKLIRTEKEPTASYSYARCPT